MARPTKQGVDYFPLDVQFDEKVELFIAETEAKGLGVLVTTWQLIYQNEGYFIHAGNDLNLLIRRRLLLETEYISGVLQIAIDRKLFCNDMFLNHNILTSKAIQKRYFFMSNKRKSISVIKNYLCEGVSVGNNCVATELIIEKTQQSKVKESKVKERTKSFMSGSELPDAPDANFPEIGRAHV